MGSALGSPSLPTNTTTAKGTRSLNYGLPTTHVERLVEKGEGSYIMGGPGTNSLRDRRLGGVGLAGTRGGTWVCTSSCSPDQEWGWWGWRVEEAFLG